MGKRELRDPIHGFIYREDVEEKIIDTFIFQRLRRIKQLALASLVYPGATHTRFGHSIGAMHVAGKMAQALGLKKDEVRLVRLSALLHDIGHGPFSHVSEPVLKSLSKSSGNPENSSKQIHELLTMDMIKSDKDLKKLIKSEERQKIIGILDGSYGDSILKGIVSGPLDADKQDYLIRDSHSCGVMYGIYDIDRLSQTLEIHSDFNDRYLAINEDGIHSLEQFVLAKYYMTTQVYRHKIRLISDAMIMRALELGVKVDKIDWLKKLFEYEKSDRYINEYKTWTDDRLTNEILSSKTQNSYAKSLFKKLNERILHKRVASYQLNIDFIDPIVRNALSNLTEKSKTKLEAKIANELSVDPHLVIVNSFMIKSVREQSRNSEASIMVLGVDGPRVFEEISTLFRSINEAFQERYIEVYAPVSFPAGSKKKQLMKKYKEKIKRLMNDVRGG